LLDPELIGLVEPRTVYAVLDGQRYNELNHRHNETLQSAAFCSGASIRRLRSTWICIDSSTDRIAAHQAVEQLRDSVGPPDELTLDRRKHVIAVVNSL
jgi:hypothetical protein